MECMMLVKHVEGKEDGRGLEPKANGMLVVQKECSE